MRVLVSCLWVYYATHHLLVLVEVVDTISREILTPPWKGTCPHSVVLAAVVVEVEEVKDNRRREQRRALLRCGSLWERQHEMIRFDHFVVIDHMFHSFARGHRGEHA